jgi:hypothetical protein
MKFTKQIHLKKNNKKVENNYLWGWKKQMSLGFTPRSLF